MKSPNVLPSPVSSKPVLAIDIDDVLAPMLYEFVPWLEKRNGVKFKMYNGMSYFVEDQLNYSHEQITEALDTFFNSDHYHALEPVEGALATIQRLKQKYEVVLVTARPNMLEVATERWLEHHFPKEFTNIHFVGSSIATKGHQTKTDVLKSVRAIALVDDSLKNIQDAAAIGLQAVLFGSYEWNHTDELPDGVIRAKNWAEVERALLGEPART